VALGATGLADGVGFGRGLGHGLGETDGSALGELEGTAAGTTATADGATADVPLLGPGVDQPPSGKDEQPPQAATNRISAGSRRSGRMAGPDWMRDSFGIATVDDSRHASLQRCSPP
jgi:hypothetical protein